MNNIHPSFSFHLKKKCRIGHLCNLWNYGFTILLQELFQELFDQIFPILHEAEKLLLMRPFLEKIWIVKFVPNKPQFIVSKDLAHEAPCERFMYVQYNLRLFQNLVIPVVKTRTPRGCCSHSRHISSSRLTETCNRLSQLHII